ncbi:hypothetical protein A4X09_0g2384 [Tilletia walkeri]|uniref:Uncharacterized protein n=1 Tax=Tilletia walkeri TaxID=117179 RepID=A0A8X7NDE4_9BASI|nr:hypothetical protein A4X09_0g2384 [Tilletia walkeri]
MDLSHLRDELANPQMDGPPAHRATHSALSAQFKQTAFNLTHFWRSSLRANENSYHRGYLAALADLREMLARIDRAEEGIDTSTRQPVSGAEQRSRLQHYLTARMEAVAEDVKATSSTLDSGASSASPNPTAAESHHDSGQPSSSQASSSHPSSSQQQIPSSPSRPAGFRLGSADAQPLRQVSAFASSTSAFNRPGGPPDSALRSLGSGIALGSSESSTPDSTQTQDGSNTAARMARLRWGRPRMRDQSAPSEADHRQSSSQETAAPSSSQQSTSSAFRSREMETDQPSSSPMVSAQSTPQTAQRPPNSLVERVALAKVARANMLSASDRSAGGVGSNASPSINSASDPATTTRGTASGHHADSPAPVEVEPTPPSTPISPLRQVQPTASSAQPASPSALLTRTTDTPNAFNFTSPSRFFSIPSAFGSSPTLGNNGTGTTTTTTAGGGGAASSFLSPSAKAPRTSSKFNSNRGSSFSRAPSTAAAEHHTDDEDERSDGGAESDVEPLRMPMVRRRPPTRTASDSDGGKEGFLAGLGSTAAGVGRPRKRRK